MITLAQLCADPAHGLRFANEASGDGLAVDTGATTELTGVHVSELDDPTPYLEGGELLLTTGIPLAGSIERVNNYVDRLARRGIVALGLGLGAGTDVVPPGLVDACSRAGVQLLVVPKDVPFMQVSRAYWDLVGKTEHADLAASLSLQTELAKAATRPEAVSSVVKVLAKAVDGWAAYLPADGSAETIFPHSERRVLPQLRQETTRIGLTGAPAAATFPLLGRDVIEYSIVADRRTAGFLAVCAGRSLRPADRQLMLTGGLLLAVTAQREWQLSRANSVLTETVATLIVNGFVEAARLVALDLGGLPIAERVQVLAVRGENVGGIPTGELADQLNAAEGRDNDSPSGGELATLVPRIRDVRLRCTIGDYSYLILESSPHGAREASANAPKNIDAQGTPSKFRAAMSRPMLTREVSQSIGELRNWCELAAPGQIITAAQVGSATALRHSAEERVAMERVRSLIAHTSPPLLDVVTSYIRHQGQWEAVARELGLHRNSVRHRIGIAAQLLGVDLDDPDVSAPLWLALRSA
jgi:purine catabolism regulator